MLNVFTLDKGRLSGRLLQEEIDSAADLAQVQPVWVDLEAPTAEEIGWIAGRFGLQIPDNIVDDDLEESARFYEEDNGELHIRSDFLIDDDVTPRNVRVAFILFHNVLFSVHAEDLPVFRLLRLRARRIPALIEDAKDVLLKLYDADAEYSADVLEGIYDKLEAVSARVLKSDVTDAEAGEVLSGVLTEPCAAVLSSLQPGTEDKVMHATLRIGNGNVMMADGLFEEVQIEVIAELVEVTTRVGIADFTARSFGNTSSVWMWSRNARRSDRPTKWQRWMRSARPRSTAMVISSPFM